MNLQWKHIVPIALLVLLSQMAFAQVPASYMREFRVKRNGKNIGWMRLIKYQRDGITTYATESEMHIQVLLDLEVKAKTTNHFMAGQLTTANVLRTINGYVKERNSIAHTGHVYAMKKRSDEVTHAEPIYHTVTSIYFAEPSPELSKVFSEVYLQYLELQRGANSVYTTLLPDGGKMIYQYSGGELVYIKSITKYGEVDFSLSK